MRQRVEVSRKASDGIEKTTHFLVLSQREYVFRNHEILISEKEIPAVLAKIKALFPKLCLQFRDKKQEELEKLVEDMEQGEKED